ncbi:MAG: hypothetical protein LAO06_18170 [Acidobacteriia bacterium]|nr:hypothetical protein [Terriglobia bacterium]
MTILAEAFAEALTPARLKLYVAELADLDQAPLASVFRRAARELKFFPKIAELRELAGANAELQTQVEAENAWHLVERDLAHNGRDGGPHLDARIEYAIRCAGGRLGINAAFSASVTDEAFTKKRFVEGFANYEAAEHLGLAQLPAALTNTLRQVASGKALPAPAPRPEGEIPTAKVAKPIPRPLSDSEVEARRALLRRQAEQLAGGTGVGDGA